MLDVIIVGGSSAGLSAALVLGRSCRNVVVYDDVQPCNRFSHASHGFLTRDGIAPDELLRIAREQLTSYSTVEVRNDRVLSIKPLSNGFTVETAGGEVCTARKVLLATGLKDELPSLEGIEQFWGQSVFHCPYCDGWEVRNQPVVVYGSTEATYHQTMLIRNLTSDLTLCTNGEREVPEQQRMLLSKNGIRLIETPVSHLEGAEGQIQRIIFADSTTLNCKAMFISPTLQHRTPFAQTLNCTLTGQNRVEVDVRGRTSVNGVYAAGDLSNPMRSVAAAVAQGFAAGAGINYDLVVEDYTAV